MKELDIERQERNKEIIAQATICSVCGEKIEFTHYIDYALNVVKESATCPECGVRFQTQQHRLN